MARWAEGIRAAVGRRGVITGTPVQGMVISIPVGLACFLAVAVLTGAYASLGRLTTSATQDEISWVITLNLVATAVATPMTGWLASRLGWRNLMFATVLGFTVASFLCGLANSLETLILARIAQGFFWAPIMPMGQAVLLATFPPHLQPAALDDVGRGRRVRSGGRTHSWCLRLRPTTGGLPS